MTETVDASSSVAFAFCGTLTCHCSGFLSTPRLQSQSQSPVNSLQSAFYDLQSFVVDMHNSTECASGDHKIPSSANTFTDTDTYVYIATNLPTLTYYLSVFLSVCLSVGLSASSSVCLPPLPLSTWQRSLIIINSSFSFNFNGADRNLPQDTSLVQDTRYTPDSDSQQICLPPRLTFPLLCLKVCERMLCVLFLWLLT